MERKITLKKPFQYIGIDITNEILNELKKVNITSSNQTSLDRFNAANSMISNKYLLEFIDIDLNRFKSHRDIGAYLWAIIFFTTNDLPHYKIEKNSLFHCIPIGYPFDGFQGIKENLILKIKWDASLNNEQVKYLEDNLTLSTSNNENKKIIQSYLASFRVTNLIIKLLKSHKTKNMAKRALENDKFLFTWIWQSGNKLDKIIKELGENFIMKNYFDFKKLFNRTIRRKWDKIFQTNGINTRHYN